MASLKVKDENRHLFIFGWVGQSLPKKGLARSSKKNIGRAPKENDNSCTSPPLQGKKEKGNYGKGNKFQQNYMKEGKR